MNFNWIDFFQKYRIPYRTDGPNCARNHAVVHCPMCGESDQSEHMGVSLDVENPVWGCWRDTKHRGQNPIRLVKALLGCSWETARDIVGISSTPDRQKFQDVIAGLFDKKKKETKHYKELVLPKSFRPIDQRRAAERYLLYIGVRGFYEDVIEVVAKYQLHYTVSDKLWLDRIILPVYYQNKLVSWTGRSIRKDVELRYETLSKEQGVYSLKDVLYEPEKGFAPADWLVVTEGPFDMMKVDFYGEKLGVRATCLFGVGFTDRQVYAIAEASALFRKGVAILFDPGTYETAFSLSDRLISMKVNCKIISVPDGIEDPGAMEQQDVEILARSLCSA